MSSLPVSGEETTRFRGTGGACLLPVASAGGHFMLNRAPGTPELSACRSPFLGSHFQKRRGREEKDPWGFCCDALPHHTEYDTGYMQPVMTKVNRLNKMGRDGGERQDENTARLALFLRMLYTNCFETLPGGQIDEVSSFLVRFLLFQVSFWS